MDLVGPARGPRSARWRSGSATRRSTSCSRARPRSSAWSISRMQAAEYRARLARAPRSRPRRSSRRQRRQRRRARRATARPPRLESEQRRQPVGQRDRPPARPDPNLRQMPERARAPGATRARTLAVAGSQGSKLAAMAHAHASPSGRDERGAGPGAPERSPRAGRATAAGCGRAAINVALLAATVVGGLLTGSLALLADAGHVLSDVAAIALGLLAAASPPVGRAAADLRLPAQRGDRGARQRDRPGRDRGADRGRRGRIGSAIRPRSRAPGCSSWGWSALAGNLAATWVLARGEREDINLEGVLRHSAADALGSLGVIVVRRRDPGHRLGADRPVGRHRDRGADPRLVGPAGARAARRPDGGGAAGRGRGAIARAVVRASTGVREVHELHVWTVTAGFEALAAHVVVAAGPDRDGARREVEFAAPGPLRHRAHDAPDGGGGRRRRAAPGRRPSPATGHGGSSR